MDEFADRVLEPGRRFGPFELVRFLGEGGGGQVWEVTEPRTGRTVALKVLTHIRAESEEARQRFEREARLAASIRHPRCVYVLGAHDIEGLPCITMELMHGGTLADHLDEGPRPVEDAVALTLELLDGLQAAHEAGVIHRDIKPSNCFLEDRSGGAKLGDFGVSKVLEEASDLSVTGAFLGTFHYASPEQIRGEKLDERSDLYSLGATLYQLLAGRRPFEGSAMAVAAQIITDVPPAPSSLNPAVPKALDQVVLKLLEKDREQRYPAAADLRKALAPFAPQGATAEPAGVGRRLAAYLIDNVVSVVPLVILAALVPALGPLFDDDAPRWDLALSVSSSSFLLLYFWITEYRWGRGIGKWLLGLQVRDLAGVPLSWRQAGIRAGTVEGAWILAALATFAVASGNPFLEFWLEPLLVVPLIVATMRPSNGYRCLHDVLSNSVVVRTGRQPRESLESGVPRMPLRFTSADPRTPGRFGPFEVLGAAWEDESGGLLVARDTRLDRTVWIRHHRHAASATRGMADQPVVEGQLPWLDGAEGSSGAWDAFGAPAGCRLIDWVEAEGPLGWEETRDLLDGLTIALQASPDRVAEPVDLSRVWVEGPARVTVLPVPTRRRDGESALPAADWHQAVAGYATSGDEKGALARAAMPARPLPLRARAWLIDLLKRESVELDGVAADLAGLRMRPVTARRRRRMVVATAALPVAVLALVAVLSAVDLLEFRDSPDAAYLAYQAESAVERALEVSTGAEAWGAIDTLRVARLLNIRDRLEDPLDPASPIARGVEKEFPNAPDDPGWIEFRAGLDSLGALHPDLRGPAADAIWRGVFWPVALDNWIGPLGVISWVLFGSIGVVAVLLAFAFRGGPILWLEDLGVVDRNGARSGRLRCALRTLAAWSPWILATPFAVLVALLSRVVLRGLPLSSAGIDLRGAIIVSFLAAIVVLAWLRGLGVSLRSPERGLQERLSGTVLVPR